MPKKTIPYLTLSAIAVSLLIFCGCFKPKPETFEKKVSLMVDKLSRELKLTEEQKKTAEELKKAILEKRKELRPAKKPAEETDIKKALTDGLRSEKFDAESFKKLLNSKRDKGDEMRDFVLKELARFHAILTVEQRQDLAKIIENGPMPGIGQRRERGPEPEKRDPDRK
ncbi:MAG: Spy/CpxP family protein refolding chaperone [Candidatus Firestonebacteria bacterium]